MVKCAYIDRCMYKKSTKCRSCKNNRVRNQEEDFYVEAKDKPFPEVNPKVTYQGPAEQTRGYECPVCGGFTNPYHITTESRCVCCGFKLNTY